MVYWEGRPVEIASLGLDEMGYRAGPHSVLERFNTLHRWFGRQK